MPRLSRRLCICGALVARSDHRHFDCRDGSHFDLDWRIGHMILRGDPAEAETLANLKARRAVLGDRRP